MSAPGKPTKPTRTLAAVWRLHAAMAAGDWRRALSIASRFPELGPQRNAILSGHGAYAHPRFYVQLGYSLDALKAAGREALIERFGRPPRRGRAQ